MNFQSEAQRRWFFANMPANAHTGLESPRHAKFANRINETEVALYERDQFQRDYYRENRDALIEADAHLSESEKRQLLAYSGHFRGK